MKNVEKITRALEMVAAARCAGRGADRRNCVPTRRAAEDDAAGRRGGRGGGTQHARLQEHEEQRTVGILLVTGDRGLAGSFNSQIIRAGLQLQRELAGRARTCASRSSAGAASRRCASEARSCTTSTSASPTARLREREGDRATTLIASYVDKDLNRVDLIYNRYVSPLTQYVRRQTLLPVQQADVFGEGVEELDPRRGRRPDDELVEAHRKALWDLRARARGAARRADPRVRPAHRSTGPCSSRPPPSTARG